MTMHVYIDQDFVDSAFKQALDDALRNCDTRSLRNGGTLHIELVVTLDYGFGQKRDVIMNRNWEYTKEEKDAVRR